MIARRHVFHIGGYDPIAPDVLLARFRRSILSFKNNWNAKTTVSDLTASTNVSASWTAEASASNWKTLTVYEMLRWDDLILQDFQRGGVSRFAQAALTLFDFIVTGTLVRYGRSSWRYTSFFLFPYFLVMAFAIFSLCTAYVASRILSWSSIGGLLFVALAATTIFIALVRWSRWSGTISHAFDDWIFSRQFLYGQRMQMEHRIDEFADQIVKRARAADTDEIVIVGHCLGAALTMQAVAKAATKDPKLGQHGPAICVLTVGATIPKFSLHPRGESARQATEAVARNPDIRWTEYHARDDIISFYRFDPVTLTHIRPDRSDGRPNIRRVQMPAMMSAASFKRRRFNFMRMHYQFLMGNDQRCAYDYCMILCGPLPFDEITGPEGGVHRFALDGSLIDVTARDGCRIETPFNPPPAPAATFAQHR